MKKFIFFAIAAVAIWISTCSFSVNGYYRATETNAALSLTAYGDFVLKIDGETYARGEYDIDAPQNAPGQHGTIHFRSTNRGNFTGTWAWPTQGKPIVLIDGVEFVVITNY